MGRIRMSWAMEAHAMIYGEENAARTREGMAAGFSYIDAREKAERTPYVAPRTRGNAETEIEHLAEMHRITQTNAAACTGAAVPPRRPCKQPIPAPPLPALGERVVTKGRHGTVRYRGAVGFADGTWPGLELDTADGKHDGTVQDRSYFQCADGHGLFVKSCESLGDDSTDAVPSCGTESNDPYYECYDGPQRAMFAARASRLSSGSQGKKGLHR